MAIRSVILLSIVVTIVCYFAFSPYVSREVFGVTRNAALSKFISQTVQTNAFDHRAYWQLRDQYGLTRGRFSTSGVDVGYQTRLAENGALGEGVAIYAIEGSFVSGIDYSVPQPLTFDEIQAARTWERGNELFRMNHIAIEDLGDRVLMQALLPSAMMSEVNRFFHPADYPELVQERNWYTVTVFLK